MFLSLQIHILSLSDCCVTDSAHTLTTDHRGPRTKSNTFFSAGYMNAKKNAQTPRENSGR